MIRIALVIVFCFAGEQALVIDWKVLAISPLIYCYFLGSCGYVNRAGVVLVDTRLLLCGLLLVSTASDQCGLRVLLCRWPSITEWEMYITAQGRRLRNDLYCVQWDVKLYYTIPYCQWPADEWHSWILHFITCCWWISVTFSVLLWSVGEIMRLMWIVVGIVESDPCCGSWRYLRLHYSLSSL